MKINHENGEGLGSIQPFHSLILLKDGLIKWCFIFINLSDSLLFVCMRYVKRTMRGDEVSEAKPHHLLIIRSWSMTAKRNELSGVSTKLVNLPLLITQTFNFRNTLSSHSAMLLYKSGMHVQTQIWMSSSQRSWYWSCDILWCQ